MGNKNYGIILAAGRGTRMKEEINKTYLPIKGKPVIAHTLEAFYESELIHEIIIVASPSEEDKLKEDVLKIYPPTKPVGVTIGGEERQDSVYNGLKILPRDADIVAIHDGARPLITSEIIDKSIKAARKYGAAVVGMPVKDTIKKVALDLRVEETLDRGSLWLIQTPQTFKYSLIMEAHELAGQRSSMATDDSTLVENMGKDVHMVEGSYDNLKITTPEDIIIVEQLIAKRGKE